MESRACSPFAFLDFLASVLDWLTFRLRVPEGCGRDRRSFHDLRGMNTFSDTFRASYDTLQGPSRRDGHHKCMRVWHPVGTHFNNLPFLLNSFRI